MKPPDDLFLFGRVVSTTAEIGSIKDCVLLYIYRARAATKLAPSELRPGELLVPPMMTNRLPWTKGYFEHLANRPLTSDDVLRTHCFVRAYANPPQYFDESGRRLDGPVDPVGEFGLQSFRTIDDQISKALGIPLSPDE